jgi:hypothetical protein
MGRRTKEALSVLAVVASMSPSLSTTGLAQGTRPNPFTSATGFRCRFSVMTSVLWKGGKPDVQTEAIDSQVTISDVDIQDATAEVSGPQGRRFASAVLSDGTLYFMESTRGALEVTTVFATESSPGKLKAVRAQHAYVFLIVPPFVEDPTVSQSYGECEPMRASGAVSP